MADKIKQIKLPNNTVYDIKDAEAEEKVNKTTVLNASSTDTQYPSAKAVYDLVQSAGAAAIQYVYTDTDSDGNIVITEQVVGNLDNNSY